MGNVERVCESDSRIGGNRSDPEVLADGRLRYEVPKDGLQPSLELLWRPCLSVTLELPNTPWIEVRAGNELPQLVADYVLVQPDVAMNDWRRGWTGLGGDWEEEVYLNREAGLQVGDFEADATVFAFKNHLLFRQSGGLDYFVTISEVPNP